MEKYNKCLGFYGEEECEKFLKRNKYKILMRNYRTKTGEIDIIANKKNLIVFVEVKTRKSEDYGSGAEAVNYYKRKSIVGTAEIFLLTYDDCEIRFDVIEVYGKIENGKFKLSSINHIENAFGARGEIV